MHPHVPAQGTDSMGPKDLSRFDEIPLAARLRRMSTGLCSPRDSRAFKLARLDLARLMAFLVALLVPVWSAVLMVACLGRSSPERVEAVTVEVPGQLGYRSHEPKTVG